MRYFNALLEYKSKDLKPLLFHISKSWAPQQGCPPSSILSSQIQTYLVMIYWTKKIQGINFGLGLLPVGDLVVVQEQQAEHDVHRVVLGFVVAVPIVSLGFYYQQVVSGHVFNPYS